jgi:hypothetical protein
MRIALFFDLELRQRKPQRSILSESSSLYKASVSISKSSFPRLLPESSKVTQLVTNTSLWLSGCSGSVISANTEAAQGMFVVVTSEQAETYGFPPMSDSTRTMINEVFKAQVLWALRSVRQFLTERRKAQESSDLLVSRDTTAAAAHQKSLTAFAAKMDAGTLCKRNPLRGCTVWGYRRITAGGTGEHPFVQ